MNLPEMATGLAQARSRLWVLGFDNHTRLNPSS